MPRYTPLVSSLPSSVPFVGPEAQERALAREFDARIGANENVFGPSPRALEAMRNSAALSWRYADPENWELREALAAHHGVSAENIVVDAGIDGLLGLLVRLLVDPGDKVVTSLGAYPTFNFQVVGFGGDLQFVPYTGFHEDVVGLVEKARSSDAKLIYHSNPNNPYGSHHDAQTISSMIEAVPDGAVLCLDEAYGEFAPGGTLVPIDVSNPRVIRMRTFSKAYGMAGIRVGYAIAHEDLANSFNKVRNHFGMNRIGQVGALAALQDQDYLIDVIEKVQQGNERIAKIAEANGLAPLPTATNFVTIDLGPEKPFAKETTAALIERGVFVRMPFVDPANRYIRVSSGGEAELDIFENLLPVALSAACASGSR